MFEVRRKDAFFQIHIKETSENEFELSYQKRNYNNSEVIEEETVTVKDFYFMLKLFCNSFMQIDGDSLWEEVERCY